MTTPIDFEDVFQYTSNGVLVTDHNGIITLINNRAQAVLQLDEKIDIGKNIINVLPMTGSAVHQCLNSCEPKLGHQILGKKAQLILNITPVLHSGLLLGAVCNFQELSVFEMAAKNTLSYQKLNRQLKTIFHSSSDGIWVCDGSGTVLDINQASEMLNGIKASEIIGYNVKELLENKIFDQSVTTKIIESKCRETVMQYISKTKRYLLSTGTPSLDDDGNIAMIVVNERDMTELNTLRNQFEESQKVKEKFEEELSELTLLELEKNSIIAESGNMRHILQMSLKLSHLGASNILILGESGTGKGLIAKLIHKNSRRRKKLFVEINCAALPENLLEAELFGYEKGAFTGASDKGKIGLFELAQGGTIFLDEMGDMPLALQAKILKYLDDQEIRRVGGTESIKISCSVVAATNRDLAKLVKEESFREDLYYRLRSFIIEIPPLRDRQEDIAGLVRFYLTEFNQKYGCSKKINPDAIRQLQGYFFPGNIRELKSVIENGVVMSEGTYIDEFVQKSIHRGDPLGEQRRPEMNLKTSLEEHEKMLLTKARKRCRTTREIATLLDISQPSVVRKLKKYNIN